MFSSRKIKFVIIFIAAFICVQLFASEPNEPNEPNTPKTDLKFEINKDIFYSWYNNHATEKGQGPIKPTYVAVIYIPESLRDNMPEDYDGIVQILNTSTARAFSEKQREFLKTSSAVVWRGSHEVKNYVTYYLYAVSEEDAKNVALAITEVINKKVQEVRDYYKKEIIELKEKLAKSKKELPGKEVEFNKIEVEYKALKDKTHPLSSEEEAVELAKKSIIEMDKTLNSLEIDLAGINEKLKAIEKYRNNPVSERAEVFTKLDVMYVELVVELSGIEAKKAMTEQINDNEQVFLSLFSERNKLHDEIGSSKSSMEKIPENIKQYNNYLNEPNLQLMNIYNNTVTIHPVADK